MGVESWTIEHHACNLVPCRSCQPGICSLHAIVLQVAWQGSGGNEKFFFDNENVSWMGQYATHEWWVKPCVHWQKKCQMHCWKIPFLSSLLDIPSPCSSWSASSPYFPFPHVWYRTNSVYGGAIKEQWPERMLEVQNTAVRVTVLLLLQDWYA